MKKLMTTVSMGLVATLCLCVGCGYNNDHDTGGSAPTIPTYFSDKTYIAFGDSITYGADYSRGYAQMDNPYPTLVASELGLKDYYNYGISGATLCSNPFGLSCISDNITNFSESYDIISVFGGVNDYNCSLPLGTFGDTTNDTIYGALDVIALSLTSRFENSFIFFMTPYKEAYEGADWSTNNLQGYNLEDVANAIKQVANEYGLPVLDLFNDGQFEEVMYNSDCDGIHPNQDFVISNTAPQIAEFIIGNYDK